MKNNLLRGSLFGLLAKNYLLFTLTLLSIGGGVFLLWDAWLDTIYRPVDWDAMLKSEALANGDYEALTDFLTGDGNAIAVYDSTGKLTYASMDDFDPAYTAQELSCIPLYQDTTITDAYETTAEDGSTQYLLIKHRYEDGNPTEVATMLLDDTYQVIFGGFGDGRSAYSPREYQLLSGRRFTDSFLSRYPFQQADGSPGTLLIRDNMGFGDAYFQRYQESWKVWLLVIPLYLADAGLFIWWLSRKIARPLRRLNDAVVSQSEGRISRVGNCGGTREIRRIGESFDRFSDRLAESEAERRRLDEGRQKLIADISHDLKTPITVIAGYADAICDGKVPPEEIQRYLHVIQAKAQTLTELVDTFHEYSKVEHPEFVLHPERTDLCEFLREYLAGKYDEIDLAGFSLDISIPERPIFCELDQPQFRRVLDNLLSNALRHNRLGTVLFFDVTVSGTQALLRVGDNGAGIPAERARHIFDPFVVGSDARTGKGSGLGLAITRRIVEKHGGTISLALRPTPGRSTEFLLRLPLDSASGT